MVCLSGLKIDGAHYHQRPNTSFVLDAAPVGASPHNSALGVIVLDIGEIVEGPAGQRAFAEFSLHIN